MMEKEDKITRVAETDLLKEQCGDDAKLYAFLCHTLYVDPAQAIPKTDLDTLVKEAEESADSESYKNAFRKYEQAVSKAIFESTQNPREKDRYIEAIQNLSPKTAKVIEKMKEKAMNEGLAERAQQLEQEIGYYRFLSRRLGDVIRIASVYYNDRLEKLKEAEKEVMEQKNSERRETARTIKKVKEDAERRADTEGRAGTEGVPSRV